MCFKGNVGRPGSPGPHGPMGEGIQGPKVKVPTVLHIESAAVSCGAYMLQYQQLPDKLATEKNNNLGFTKSQELSCMIQSNLI